MSKKPRLNITEFQFLGDHALVRSIKKEELVSEKSKMGLIRPDQYDAQPEYGIIVAIGPGRITDTGEIIPTKVKVGDTVFFGMYSSVKTRFDGEDYYIIREEDIMAFHS